MMPARVSPEPEMARPTLPPSCDQHWPPGVAMMVVLVSRGGFATVTARYDRASIAHPELFAQCLRQGFDEVLALAGDPVPRVVPASFPDLPDQSAQMKNGSVAYS